jgi:hypothetical protein
VSDLVDPTKPWRIADVGSGFFDFVPTHLREGPWSVTAAVGLFTILYVLVLGLVAANSRYEGGDIMREFVLPPDAYLPYTPSWYYNVTAACWMTYVSYTCITSSTMGGIAWVSFTLWSWTIITIRHGLCAAAPFLPQVRVLAEILRLPVLMSASVTFGVWNFVLMPAITFVFIKDSDKRWGFLKFATGFRLTQLHVFNIAFAVLNGAYTEPRRPLHLGDLNCIFWYTATYMMFYYFVLDRIGIHLYPIFSPRAPWVVFSWLLVVALNIYGYHRWSEVLAAT